MAADVGQRFSGWSYSDVPYNDHDSTQDPSVQQMVLDHGSVSFGRFAAESLSWEKRSVFAYNRRQEELRKLTAPGLVAQKKAFFEEYYKRARLLKAQGAAQQNDTTMEERSNENIIGQGSEADQLPAVVSDDPGTSAPSSSFEPSNELSSSDERNCQDGHELRYLTFNPLFSQTAGLQNIQQQERSRSGQKQYLDREFPSTTHTSNNHGLKLNCEALAPRCVVSDENDERNVAGTRIVLPIASLQLEALEVDCEKQEPRRSIVVTGRSMKRHKELSTSVIHIPRVDFRRNSENRPSQESKDPFHKRVEMKLRALSDRMNADRAATSSRSASYQPSDRAMTSCRSSSQNAGRVATSSRSSLCQNTEVLASSKSAGQASHKSHKGVRREDTLPRGIFANKRSLTSHVASNNNTATGKSAPRVVVLPSSSQVNAKISRDAQVTLKRAGLTSIGNGSQNKRKQLSTPVALDENNPKRGYVRKSAPPSARSSTDNLPPAAKAPKISSRKNVTKTETVQKPTYASHHVAGGRNLATERTANSDEQNRKVIPSRAGSLAGSSMRSNLNGGPSLSKNKPRQERPRWR